VASLGSRHSVAVEPHLRLEVLGIPILIEGDVPGRSLIAFVKRAPFSSLTQRLPGSRFSPWSIARIAACLRWNGWVEVVFAVP
jgi:hypothetical protein